MSDEPKGTDRLNAGLTKREYVAAMMTASLLNGVTDNGAFYGGTQRAVELGVKAADELLEALQQGGEKDELPNTEG